MSTATTAQIPAPRPAPERVWVNRFPEYDGLDFGDTSSDNLYEGE